MIKDGGELLREGYQHPNPLMLDKFLKIDFEMILWSICGRFM
jgi:hypothetical protein